MTAKYKRTEVDAKVDSILPKSYEDDLTDEGLRRGTGLRKRLLSMTGGLFSADPDSILGIMKLGAHRVVKKSGRIITNLHEINTLLTAASLPPPSIPTGQVTKIRSLFNDLTLVGDRDYKKRKIREIDTSIKSLISETKNAAGAYAGKGPDLAKLKIMDLLIGVEEETSDIQAIHRNFFSAITNALNNSLALETVEDRAKTIVGQLDGYQGISLSLDDISDTLLISSVGLALMDDGLKIPNPLAPKYNGSYSVSAGQAATLTSTKSLPLSESSDKQVSVTIDTEVGAIQVPMATRAALAVAVPSSLFPYPHNLSIVTDPITGDTQVVKTPVDTPVLFALVVDNQTYLLNSASYLADLDALVALLNGTALGTIASSSGEILTITSPTYGSRSRILFFDDSGGINGNSGLALTHARVGEVRGLDTFFDSLSLSGFTSDPTLSSSLETVGAISAVPVLSGTTHKVPTALSVQVGDKILFAGSYYEVSSVEIGHAVITGKFLRRYDSATGLMVEADVDSAASFTFVQDLVTVQSPSTAHGTTKVSGTGDSILGMTSTGSSGGHNKIILGSSINDGSPVRIGDVVLDASNSKFGRISRSVDKQLEISLDPGKTFPTGNIAILAQGAHSYGELENRRSEVFNAFATIREVENQNFIGLIKQFIFSGSGREVVIDLLVKYVEAFSVVNSVYASFSAIVTRETKEFLNSLAETGLIVVKDILLDLDFANLRYLTTDDLSRLGKITKGLDVLSYEISGGDDYIYIENSDPRYGFTPGYDEESDTLADGEFITFASDLTSDEIEE